MKNKLNDDQVRRIRTFIDDDDDDDEEEIHSKYINEIKENETELKFLLQVFFFLFLFYYSLKCFEMKNKIRLH